MIWSINKVRTLIEFLQLACYGMIYIVVRNLDEDNKYRVGRIAYIVGVAIAILSICEYVFVNSTRMQGTFTNPNPFGIYTAIVFARMGILFTQSQQGTWHNFNGFTGDIDPYRLTRILCIYLYCITISFHESKGQGA